MNTLPVNVSTYLVGREDNAMIWKHAHAKWMHKLHCLCPSEPVTCLSVKNTHIIVCRKSALLFVWYFCRCETASLPALRGISSPITRQNKLVIFFSRSGCQCGVCQMAGFTSSPVLLQVMSMRLPTLGAIAPNSLNAPCLPPVLQIHPSGALNSEAHSPAARLTWQIVLSCHLWYNNILQQT